MSKKILCPFHAERTPSCVLYPNGFWCAGCGAKGPLSALNGVDITNIEKPEPEDLEASIAAIQSLPKKLIRGLELHADERSFYIVWPDHSYYKRRFLTGNGPKYIGAAGHALPLFVANKGTNSHLVIVEGELNALSLAVALPEYTIVSPGGSGHFEPRNTRKWLPSIVRYGTIESITVIADEDVAGAKAVIELLSELRQTRKQLFWKLVKKDANQVLQEGGSEQLRRQVLEILQGKMAEST